LAVDEELLVIGHTDILPAGALGNLARRSCFPSPKEDQLKRVVMSSFLFVALVGSACAASEGEIGVTADNCSVSSPVNGRELRIVTTVAPITSLVAQVVGDGGAQIVGLVPEGTNSHTFEPPPSAAAVVEQADVVFMNGLVLEEPTKDLASSNAKDNAVICELGTAILPEEQWIFDFSFPVEGGKPNPHLWTNPPMAREYAELIRDVLSSLDPSSAETYAENFNLLATQIDELDVAMSTATQSLPEAKRLLLTYHDAYAYFAKQYNWTVVGAIQPSSFDEPTPKDIANLVDQIRARGVPAIFGSEVFPSPVLEQIGAETGTRYIDVLRDDDLPGESGESDHSWQGLMRFNFVTMVEALGGDASSLRQLTMAPAVVDRAEYAK
ncbi:MAG: metal ABC transporter substrate-binding protein, partial [Ilumatobacteraceae bacterium]